LGAGGVERQKDRRVLYNCATNFFRLYSVGGKETT